MKFSWHKKAPACLAIGIILLSAVYTSCKNNPDQSNKPATEDAKILEPKVVIGDTTATSDTMMREVTN